MFVDEEETPVAGARVEVVEGRDTGKTAQASEDGRFVLSSLQEGPLEIEASAEGFEPEFRKLSLTANQTIDIGLRRPAPPPGPSPPTPPPPTPPPPAPPPVRVFSGTVVEGISDAAIAGATVEVPGLGVFTTQPNGTFQIEAADPESVRTVTISAPAIVPRTTHLRIPGPDTELTAIPSSFDLAAFDQMFRSGGQLQRWTSAPHLTIQRRVLQFSSVTAQEYIATDDLITDADVDLMVADLAWGVPQLTDGQLGFASERRETAESGATVPVARTGEIVVARFFGLQAATGFWGYGRWASDGAGTIRAGIIMLDADFDSSGSAFRRSLRVHELGHALGYSHVTARESVMNASARTEPNEFDRHGARIAFLRPPGNRAPDSDPDQFTINIRTGVLIWSGDR